ncbi:microtubule binding protein [Exidia glandulosa HHB12029]|uniref:Microtubule binding protein n=1 Tax=Exidia glandulosa HHB12029 TaxID=1314781 RepID=A0A165JW84_EXIGL|nr:microtubule binding protein [Exidia glandulosa HHB12029]
MGESRTELIQWVNDLLQINYTKVEQCGSGAAYCQIIDSIYGDIPMSRVKMNARLEYEYLVNYKVLQNAFKAHKIDKPILVEKLTKCKMQDNLEFLQWLKRFWEQNYGGHEYDPVARRKGAPMENPATLAPVGAAPRAPSSAGVSRGKTPVGGARIAPSANAEQIANLTAQMREMSTHLEGLEKERDFYFSKLRDIEILAQQQIEVLEGQGKDDETLREIQKILYSTEEGFEVPEGTGVDEEETF